MKSILQGKNTQSFKSLPDYNAKEVKRLEKNFKLHLSDIKKRIDQLNIRALQKKIGTL